MIGKPLKVGLQRNFGRNISITEDKVSLDGGDNNGMGDREAAEAETKRGIKKKDRKKSKTCKRGNIKMQLRVNFVIWKIHKKV